MIATKSNDIHWHNYETCKRLDFNILYKMPVKTLERFILQIKDITDVQIVMPTSGEDAVTEDAKGLILVSEHGELKQAS